MTCSLSPRSTIGASLMGCLQFAVSQTASSERSAPALTNWIRYWAATAAAGVSVSLCPSGLLLPWPMRTGWKMLINIELFLFRPFSGGEAHRAQQSHRKTRSYAFFSSIPRGPDKWRGGREKCPSHGRFNIPNLGLLKVLLLTNQDHENLPPEWARALKSLFKCIRFSWML